MLIAPVYQDDALRVYRPEQDDGSYGRTLPATPKASYLLLVTVDETRPRKSREALRPRAILLSPAILNHSLPIQPIAEIISITF